VSVRRVRRMTSDHLHPDHPRVLIHARGTMTPDETAFWNALRAGLNEHGLELMLIAHHRPKGDVAVPVLRVHNGLDVARPPDRTQGWQPWLAQQVEPIDEAPLLERERLWRGPETSPEQRENRRRALYWFRAFYAEALRIARPVLTLIWNGHHAQEMLLDTLCRECRCPVAYIERGPFRGTIQVDTDGVLGGSRIASLAAWDPPEPKQAARWLESMRAIEQDYRSTQTTWWEQPESLGADAVRRRLGIRPERRVLLFAGQVDEDVQNLLYAPEYPHNLAAFKAFCDLLRGRNDIYILGKHHPKSRRAPAEYDAVLGSDWCWASDLSLADCLAVADRVAAVNSTVLYEALMLEKPVLAMGRNLLSGKGIAYELAGRPPENEQIQDWLNAEDFSSRLDRWREFGAFLLANALYATSQAGALRQTRGARELAADLAEMAPATQTTPEWGKLPAAGPPFLDDIGLIEDAREQSRTLYSDVRACLDTLGLQNRSLRFLASTPGLKNLLRLRMLWRRITAKD